MANVIPFWDGMAAWLGVAAALGVRKMPWVAPRWSDWVLGSVLGVATWGAVRLLLPTLLAFLPAMADGFHLVAGYAHHENLAWAVLGMTVIAAAEELVWRWYLPWRIGRGRYGSAVLAALPYAGMHLFTGCIPLAASALGFGVLWGLTTAWRGSPWVALAWHVVFDWLVFLVAPPQGI